MKMRSHSAPYRRESEWLAPRPLLYALRARARLLLLTSGILLACLAALIYSLPKEYESRMQLLLSSEREEPLAGVDSNATATRVSYFHEARVNSEIELLRSTDVLTKVVLKSGLQKLELAEDQSAGETSPLTLEKALQRLRNNLNITPVKRSNILQVSYSGLTPELANTVLRALADTYVERRVEVHSTPATVTFLRRQSVAWQGVLARAEEDLVRCRRLYSGFVLPEERAAFAKRAMEAQTAAEQADAQVAEYIQKVQMEREELAQFRSRAVSYSRRNRLPHFAGAE